MSFLEEKQKELYAKRVQLQMENDKKILLLDKHLKTDKAIKEYIALNRLNLPSEKEWDKVLPIIIKKLLAIGWNTEIKIQTKRTYGLYRINFITDDSNMRVNAHRIVDEYMELFELGRL